jgi:hypothetical protein
MAVDFVAEPNVSVQDRFAYFWTLRGEWVDEPDLRRHSSFSATAWQKLVYFYETAFGSAIKGLH